MPPAGKLERYRVQEWLNFITPELHKTFGPIFRPTTPDAFKALSKENLGKRFDWLDKQLAGKHYLMGDKFTVADAYPFTVLRWTSRIDIDLAKWPNLKAYVDRCRRATSMGSRRSELIGYRVELTQGEPVRPPSFLKFPVP